MDTSGSESNLSDSGVIGGRSNDVDAADHTESFVDLLRFGAARDRAEERGEPVGGAV